MRAYRTALTALRRAFVRGADDRRLQPATMVAAALQQRLALLPIEPRRVLELGAPTAAGARALAARGRHAQLVAVDFERGSPRIAATHRPWQRRPRRVLAVATQLPFRGTSIDLVYSNLLLQRLPDLAAVFADVRRVLRVDGWFCFSALGAATLAELSAARAASGESAPAPSFPDLLELGDALLRAGFADPVIDVDRHTLTYVDLASMLRDLRLMGGRTAARTAGLGGRARLRRLAAAYEPARRADGRLPATFEIVYGRAFNPEPAAPGVPAEVTIAPAAIGRRRR